MAIVKAHRGPVTSAAVTGLAISAAVALHVALLTGWQRDPGHPLQPAFVEREGIQCDCLLPAGMVFPLQRSEATVRCDVGRLGELRNCHWTRESSPGAGDATVAYLQGHWDGRMKPAFRGRRGVEFTICLGNGCPIS